MSETEITFGLSDRATAALQTAEPEATPELRQSIAVCSALGGCSVMPFNRGETLFSLAYGPLGVMSQVMPDGEEVMLAPKYSVTGATPGCYADATKRTCAMMRGKYYESQIAAHVKQSSGVNECMRGCSAGIVQNSANLGAEDGEAAGIVRRTCHSHCAARFFVGGDSAGGTLMPLSANESQAPSSPSSKRSSNSSSGGTLTKLIQIDPMASTQLSPKQTLFQNPMRFNPGIVSTSSFGGGSFQNLMRFNPGIVSTSSFGGGSFQHLVRSNPRLL